jgi:hypothetical protein
MGAEQAKAMGAEMGTEIGTTMGSANGVVWYKERSEDAKKAKETLHIYRKGYLAYTILPYYPDMCFGEYLKAVIVPELELKLSEDGDTVEMCIGWVNNQEDDVVLFDFENRQKRLGDLIKPGSDLFCQPMEEGDLHHFRCNATS